MTPTSSSMRPSSSSMCISFDRGDGMIISGEGAGDLTTVAWILCEGVAARLTGIVKSTAETLSRLIWDLSELPSECRGDGKDMGGVERRYVSKFIGSE